MSRFASLPLFTDAWVADTKHLSRLERGTYHDLLVLMWRSSECRLPDDDDWLSRRLGMTIDEVQQELRPLIAEFCYSSGNWIMQKRLMREWEWCTRNSKKRSDAAKLRWDKEKDASKCNAPILSSLTDSLSSLATPSLELEEVEEEQASGRALWSFEEFWKLYPNKVGKRAAKRAFLVVSR